MNEQRQAAYLKLIDQLLVSPADIAEIILRANSHLIEARFIQKLEQKAEFFKKSGDGNQADFLINIATKLIKLMQDFSEQSAYLALIQEVLLSVRYFIILVPLSKFYTYCFKRI